MNKLTLDDVRPPSRYEPVRDEARRKAIVAKRPRRVALGDRVTVVFENRATMIFQVEEMLRAEKLEAPDKIRAELDVYNSLLPDAGELSATLFVEVPAATEIRSTLHSLVGIDEHVTLDVGGVAVRAQFEPGRSEADRIAAVQYIRFALPPDAQKKLATPGTPVVLRSDLPGYAHAAVLGEETRTSLAADLQ